MLLSEESGSSQRGPDVSFVVSLASTRGAAAQARHIVQRRLGGRVATRPLEDVLLIISELVTNAVLHGHGDVGLRITYEGGQIAGTVSDDGHGFTHEIDARDPAGPGGRGLHVVDQLTTGWGVDQHTSHVWFEVSAGVVS